MKYYRKFVYQDIILYLCEEDGFIVSCTTSSKDYIKDTYTDILDKTCIELEEFFTQKRKYFDVPYKFKGTVFQEKVWEALTKIPYGQTCSYGEISAKIGNSKASRAVGHACNQNPIMIIIPCHRVIGKKGNLVGFGGGLPLKKKLLDIEKSELL